MKAIFKAVTLGLLAIAATPSISNAADLGAPAPAYSPTPVANWNGFYAGLHGGGGWGWGDSTFLSGAPSAADFGVSGPYVGGQIGYNWQNDGYVFGLEGDISWSGIHGVRVTSTAGGTTTQDINAFGTIRGRLGMPMGNWMPYVTGGWAWASGTRTNNGSGPQTASASHSGWTLGLGAEWAVASNWTVKGEYKYIALGGGNYMFSPNPSSVAIGFSTLELGVNYHY